MTPKEELIQAIERSPNEVIWALLEILKILQRQLPLTDVQLAQQEAELQFLHPNSRQITKPENLAASLIGIAKTDTAPPTDEEVKAILDERLVQKYL